MTCKNKKWLINDNENDVANNEIESIMCVIDEYYNETKHLQYISDYRHILLNEIIYILIPEQSIVDDIMETMEEIIEELLEYYLEIQEVPKYSHFCFDTNDINIPHIEGEIGEIIIGLMDVPIVEQRTQEWLEMRHNMLSASNIYRAFKSPATINSLIRDKSTPLTLGAYNAKGGLDNPMGWGTIFEPVSVSVYEYIYETTVGLFGCIQHPQWDFIGASPDGINISPGERYGRMLEIKNIYNREITGIPADEYWVQMQVQMEVCNLPACDFLETRFCLYKTEEEFMGDVDCDFRGILLEHNGEYAFHYLWDYDGDMEYFMEMVEVEKARMGDFIGIHWWYLDEFSCVLVKRNIGWFDAILPRLTETWSMIMAARNGTNDVPIVSKGRKKNVDICLIKL